MFHWINSNMKILFFFIKAIITCNFNFYTYENLLSNLAAIFKITVSHFQRILISLPQALLWCWHINVYFVMTEQQSLLIPTLGSCRVRDWLKLAIKGYCGDTCQPMEGWGWGSCSLGTGCRSPGSTVPPPHRGRWLRLPAGRLWCVGYYTAPQNSLWNSVFHSASSLKLWKTDWWGCLQDSAGTTAESSLWQKNCTSEYSWLPPGDSGLKALLHLHRSHPCLEREKQTRKMSLRSHGCSFQTY